MIGAARRSWVHDLIERAGGHNALADCASQTLSMTDAPTIPIDLIAMSWCGVKADKYRRDVVLRREHWQSVRAVQQQNVVAISEAFLGRPGPRLVQGYQQLRAAIASCAR